MQMTNDEIWAELSKVYNLPNLPEEATEIIGDLMLKLGDDWIPCSERLPDQEGAYLVTIDERETEEGIPGVEKVLWHKRQWETYSPMFNGLYPIGLKVTAWMPLPDSYKP